MKKVKETIGAAGILVTALFALAGCPGWGSTTCKVVDAASAACTVLKYMGPDGKEHEVRVSREEMAAFGEEAAAKRAAEKAGLK